MAYEKKNSVKSIHLILGGLFLVGGILTLIESDVINGLWYTSLAFFFLFDAFQDRIKSRVEGKLITGFFYVLKAMVLVTGIVAILRILKII